MTREHQFDYIICDYFLWPQVDRCINIVCINEFGIKAFTMNAFTINAFYHKCIYH